MSKKLCKILCMMLLLASLFSHVITPTQQTYDIIEEEAMN